MSNLSCGLQGRRFFIKRDSVVLGAYYANAKRFVWEVNGKSVSGEYWIKRLKKLDPQYNIPNKARVYATVYNMAYRDQEILGALAVARFASEIGLLEQMCQPSPGGDQSRRPISDVVEHPEFLYMDPVEAFERFGLPEEEVSPETVTPKAGTGAGSSSASGKQESGDLSLKADLKAPLVLFIPSVILLNFITIVMVKAGITDNPLRILCGCLFVTFFCVVVYVGTIAEKHNKRVEEARGQSSNLDKIRRVNPEEILPDLRRLGEQGNQDCATLAKMIERIQSQRAGKQ